MTERKPPGMSFETWVDTQISQGLARGDFDGLEGAGKPLSRAALDETGYEWVVAKARRENLDLLGMLPPGLALRKERDDLPRRAEALGPGYLLVARTLAPAILSICGIVAAFFFLRGHNAPGGGFVAGLVMSIGFLFQYIAFGTEWVEDRLRLAPRVLIGVGLLLVLGTAVGPLVIGYPLLTSHTFHLELPLIGDIHVGSAMFFDLGVFCEVLGSTLLIVIALAHQSIRARRATGGE